MNRNEMFRKIKSTEI